MDDGVINGQSILPDGWTNDATTSKTLTNGETLDYGYLWWPEVSDTGRLDQAYTAEGIHRQFLCINRAVELMIVLWSSHPHPTGGRAVHESTFFQAVAERLRER